MTQEQQSRGAVVSASYYKDNVTQTQVSYYFDICTEHSLSLQNNITDNYLENNTAVQDQIAHNPLTLTLSGFIGELVYMPTDFNKDNLTNEQNWMQRVQNNKAVKFATDKLGPIKALYPEVSNVDQLARNAAELVDASVKRFDNVFGVSDWWESRKNKPNQDKKEEKPLTETRLQEVYRKLKQLRDLNVLLEVYTPYQYQPFEYMAIQSVTLKQGNENFVSDISISLKQINFAETKTTKPDTKVMSQYNAVQRTEEANYGKTTGVNADNSIAYTTLGNGAKYSNYKK